MFKTTESGGKGQLLDGDPSFVTNDEALVKNLNLNYKVVYAGSEAALIQAFRQAEANKTPLIGYFYEPQWFMSEVPLVKVNLPPYTEGCDADAEKIACDYPKYDLDKIVATKFVEAGGPAVQPGQGVQVDQRGPERRSPSTSPRTAWTRRRPRRSGSGRTRPRSTPGWPAPDRHGAVRTAPGEHAHRALCVMWSGVSVTSMAEEDRRMTDSGRRKRIAIACQGGGSHTAFTAGVLPALRLRGDGPYEVVGLSGTSGGAVCALLTWRALVDGGPERVGPALRRFWADNSAGTPWQRLLNSLVIGASALQNVGAAPAVSPYDSPVAALDQFRALLESQLDFDKIEVDRLGQWPMLLVGAVDVLSGEFRAFNSRRDRITADVVLASAAIPSLFPAVHAEGGTYWDGLFSQNPPVRELVETEPDEIWVIQINPKERDSEPRSVVEIVDRRNELAGNLSLYQELHFIEEINRLLDAGLLAPGGRYRHVVVRVIELSRSRRRAARARRRSSTGRRVHRRADRRGGAAGRRVPDRARVRGRHGAGATPRPSPGSSPTARWPARPRPSPSAVRSVARPSWRCSCRRTSTAACAWT